MSEKIGDAYIEVLLRQNKRSLDRLRQSLTKEAGKAGDEAGDEYGKRFNKAWIDAEKGAAARVAERLKAVELVDWDKMGEEAGKEYGDAAGRNATTTMRKRLLNGTFRLPAPQFDEDGNMLDFDLVSFRRDLNDQLLQLAEKYHADDERQNEKSLTRLLKQQEDYLKAEDRARRKAHEERLRLEIETSNAEQRERANNTRGAMKEFVDRLKQEDSLRREREQAVIAAGKREGKAWEEKLKRDERALVSTLNKMTADYDKFVKGQRDGNESLMDGQRRLRAALVGIGDEFERLGRLNGRGYTEIQTTIRSMYEGVDRVNPRLRALNGRLDDFIPRAGRAFGRGSRSDIVNLFGAMVEGGFRAVQVIPRVAEKVSGMVSAFKALPDSLTTVQKLGQTFAGAGLSVGRLGAAFASFAAALPVVIVIVGTLVAALSLLLGVIVALASTVYFSLIAAIGAIGGAIVPVVFGIGVLVAAITSLSDAQKEALKTAIKPFVEGVKEIGRAAADTLFGGERFQRTISNMTSALTSSNMKALVVDIADAIGDIGDSWAKALNSQGFQNWLATMRETLPNQLRTLGEIGKNTFGGIGGIIVGLQPITDRFLNWLERITQEFSDWANSVEGRQEIVDFFQRAGDSAVALGGFLKEVGGLIQDIFTAGQSTGDSIFEDMTNAVRDFRDYIADGGLEQWFKDTKDFAEDLGGALKTVGEILDALDNAATRFTASGAFQLLTWLYDLGQLITDVTPSFDDFVNIIKGIAELDFGKIKEGLLGMMPNFEDFGLDVDWAGVVDNIVSFFGGLGEGIATAISSATSGIWNFLTEGLPNAFSEAMAGLGNLGGLLLETLGMILTPVGEFFKSFFIEFFAQFGIDIVAVLQSIGASFAAVWDGIKLAAEVTWTWISDKWNELSTTLSEGFAAIGTVFAEKWDGIKSKASEGWDWVKDKWNEATTPLKEGFAAVQTSFSEKWDNIKSKSSETWDSIKSKGSEMWSGLKSGASDFASDAGSKLGEMAGKLNPIKIAIDLIKGAFNLARDAAKSLADAVSKIKIPSFSSLKGSGIPFIPGVATGGMIYGQGLVAKTKLASGGFVSTSSRMYRGANISEAGIEAVVPLQRPLGQVDPSVRDLAAYAQGKVGKEQKNIDMSGWQIISPQADPEAVAHEVANIILGGLL